MPILLTTKSYHGTERRKSQPVEIDEDLVRQIVKLAVEQAVPEAAKLAAAQMEDQLFRMLGREFAAGVLEAAKGLIGKLLALSLAVTVAGTLFLASKGIIKIPG